MMETIEQRVLWLRKHLNLTQSEFAEKIGLKQTILSQWESGDMPIVERNIKAIFLTFNVSENWLRNGEGEVFENMGKLSAIYRQLSPDHRILLIDIGNLLIARNSTT
jgi:transcriptional regulator with XRE-family HTH domain